jgi:AmmeMemoRadiSam system protein B
MREPAVAGQFYPAMKKELLAEIKKCFSVPGEPSKTTGENKVTAAVCPHAGYVYSGSTAAFSYKAIKEDKTPKTVVIIGPNHSGIGPGVSVYPDDFWSTPLGEVEVDSQLAGEIADDVFLLDKSAHEFEHSVEVQIPFLQYLYDGFRVVPICVMDQTISTMRSLGEKLAKVLSPKEDLVIASSDFSHYIAKDAAYKRDMMAVKAITKLDEKELYDSIEKYDISMCGPGAVIAAMVYSRKAGVREGKLLKYQTSGDVTGDTNAVVGYGSIVFKL